MSETIRKVRLKNERGEILHPEIEVDTELSSSSNNAIANKTANIINNRIGCLYFNDQTGMTNYLVSNNVDYGQLCIYNNKKYKVVPKLIAQHDEPLIVKNETINYYQNASAENIEGQTAVYFPIPDHAKQFNINYSVYGSIATSYVLLKMDLDTGKYIIVKRVTVGMQDQGSLTVDVSDQPTAEILVLDSVITNTSTITIADYNVPNWTEDKAVIDTELSLTSNNAIANSTVSTYLKSINNYVETSGTASAYTASLQNISEYYDGMSIIILPHAECVDNPTLQINSLEALPIKNSSGNNVTTGDIKANIPLSLVRVGNSFFIRGGSSTPPSTNSVNLFIQPDEPEIKKGLWIQSNTDLPLINMDKDKALGYSDINTCTFGNYLKSTYLNGNIYMIDFYNSNEFNAKKICKYDTENNKIEQIADLELSAHYSNIVASDKLIYVIAGNNSLNVSYDPITGTTTKLAKAPTNQSCKICYKGDFIYIFTNGDNYKYSISTDTWSAFSPLTNITINSSYNYYCNNFNIYNNLIYFTFCRYEGGPYFIYQYNQNTDVYTNINTISNNYSIADASFLIGDCLYSFTHINNNDRTKSCIYNFKSGLDTVIENCGIGVLNCACYTGNNTAYIFGRTSCQKFGLDSNKLALYNGDSKSVELSNHLKLNFDSIKYVDSTYHDLTPKYYIGNGTSWDLIS